MALGAEETCDVSPKLAPTQNDEEGNPYFSVLFRAEPLKCISTPVSHLSSALSARALLRLSLPNVLLNGLGLRSPVTSMLLHPAANSPFSPHLTPQQF